MFVALKWQDLLENMMIPQFLEILIQNSSIAMKRPLRFWKSLEENYNSLINQFEKLGNPFICNSDENDLIQVNTRDIMVQEVVEAIHEIEEIGKLQADTFISERIVTKTCFINDLVRKKQVFVPCSKHIFEPNHIP